MDTSKLEALLRAWNAATLAAMRAANDPEVKWADARDAFNAQDTARGAFFDERQRLLAAEVAASPREGQ